MGNTVPHVGRQRPPVRIGESSPTGLVYDGGPKDGQKVGGKSGKYWMVKWRGQYFLAHRLVYELHTGELLSATDFIDHIDRDTRNNKPSNLRKVSRAENARNRKLPDTNTSGHAGVMLARSTTRNYSCWRAVWNDLDGKVCSRSFSVSRWGDDTARLMAIAYRKRKIEELNAQGAGYRETHGKPDPETGAFREFLQSLLDED